MGNSAICSNATFMPQAWTFPDLSGLPCNSENNRGCLKCYINILKMINDWRVEMNEWVGRNNGVKGLYKQGFYESANFKECGRSTVKVMTSHDKAV